MFRLPNKTISETNKIVLTFVVLLIDLKKKSHVSLLNPLLNLTVVRFNVLLLFDITTDFEKDSIT